MDFFFGNLLVKTKHQISSYLPYSLFRQKKKFYKYAFNRATKQVKRRKKITRLASRGKRSQKEESDLENSVKEELNSYEQFLFSFIMVFFPALSFAIYIISWFFLRNEFWFFGVMGLTFILRLLYDLYFQPRDVSAYEYNLYRLDAHKVYPYIFFSTVITTGVILLINLLDLPISDDNVFFELSKSGSTIPLYPMILSCFHFIFIAINIYISLRLLIYVVEQRRLISIIGIMNIFFCYFTSILFYAVICYISKPEIINIPNYFNNGFFVILEKITLNKIDFVDNLLSDDYIVLIISVFVPLTLYMSIYVFIAVSKLIIKVLSAFFKALIQQELTVIARLGALFMAIAAIIAAIKGINEL